MKRLLIRVLAGAFVIGGFVAVLWPVPTWRLYDANWQPLAMTQAEAWCAGWTMGNAQANKQDPAAMKDCMETHDELDNEIHGIATIIRQGCLGFGASSGFDPNACEAIIESNGIWWLRDGGFTLAWNETNPRPQVIQVSIQNAPRGERDNSEREYTGRLGP